MQARFLPPPAQPGSIRVGRDGETLRHEVQILTALTEARAAILKWEASIFVVTTKIKLLF